MNIFNYSLRYLERYLARKLVRWLVKQALDRPLLTLSAVGLLAIAYAAHQLFPDLFA